MGILERPLLSGGDGQNCKAWAKQACTTDRPRSLARPAGWTVSENIAKLFRGKLMRFSGTIRCRRPRISRARRRAILGAERVNAPAHALLVVRANRLARCVDVFQDPSELEMIADAIEAYAAIRWPERQDWPEAQRSSKTLPAGTCSMSIGHNPGAHGSSCDHGNRKAPRPMIEAPFPDAAGCGVRPRPCGKTSDPCGQCVANRGRSAQTKEGVSQKEHTFPHRANAQGALRVVTFGCGTWPFRY